MSSELLYVRALRAGYGSAPVLEEVTLRVAPGEVVGLIGANGAGKSTTLKTISGHLSRTGGTIDLIGGPARGAPHRRARQGLQYVTEERSVFMTLSAADNLRVGRVKAADVVRVFPELQGKLRTRAGLLSGGEQQMLSLGRALARKPKLLLGDELSLGLAPLIVRRLLDQVRLTATEEGLGALLVEQHVSEILRVADRVYVMHRGRIVLEGTAHEVRSQLATVQSNYLGATAEKQAEAELGTNSGSNLNTRISAYSHFVRASARAPGRRAAPGIHLCADLGGLNSCGNGRINFKFRLGNKITGTLKLYA